MSWRLKKEDESSNCWYFTHSNSFIRLIMYIQSSDMLLLATEKPNCLSTAHSVHFFYCIFMLVFWTYILVTVRVSIDWLSEWVIYRNLMKAVSISICISAQNTDISKEKIACLCALHVFMRYDNFRKPWCRKFLSVLRSYLQRKRVKIVSDSLIADELRPQCINWRLIDRLVNVKVTVAKKTWNFLFPHFSQQ